MAVIKIVPMPGLAVEGPAGPQGPRGYQGDTGLTGPQGPAGSDGEDGATPFTLVGAYDNGASYNLGIAVYYGGGTYVRTGNPLNPGYPPTVGAINESWTPIAEKGDQGPIPDLESSFPEISYQVQGGAYLNQPTFNGTPMFDGSYIKTGSLVHFRITVDMDNITSFGTGQYYVELPFIAKYHYYFRDGNITDFSTSKKFAISGHTIPGSKILNLSTTANNGEEVAFTSSVPFNLAVEDDFHISGSYISQ
jgi:hypothetical protein